MPPSTHFNDQAVTVAIVNTNPDLVRVLRVALESAGFIVFVIHIEDIKLGIADINSFLEQNDPKVVVYDVAPPYGLNWRTLEHIRTATAFRGRQFVLTTMNRAALERIVGVDETVYEVVGEAEDVAQIVRATKEASRSRPTR